MRRAMHFLQTLGICIRKLQNCKLIQDTVDRIIPLEVFCKLESFIDG